MIQQRIDRYCSRSFGVGRHDEEMRLRNDAVCSRLFPHPSPGFVFDQTIIFDSAGFAEFWVEVAQMWAGSAQIWPGFGFVRVCVQIGRIVTLDPALFPWHSPAAHARPSHSSHGGTLRGSAKFAAIAPTCGPNSAKIAPRSTKSGRVRRSLGRLLLTLAGFEQRWAVFDQMCAVLDQFGGESDQSLAEIAKTGPNSDESGPMSNNLGPMLANLPPICLTKVGLSCVRPRGCGRKNGGGGRLRKMRPVRPKPIRCRYRVSGDVDQFCGDIGRS